MLQFHASENKVHQLRLCISSGEYDIDEQDGNGWTALHYAAFAGRASLECLALLIELEADLDVKTKKGDVALHIAAREGHMESVKRLLRGGAAIEIPNAQNITPMDMLKRFWREIREDIDAGAVAREENVRRKKEAAERIALQRKQEAAAQPDKQVAKKEVSAETRRQRYMELREKLVFKMKFSKASHTRGMHAVEQDIEQLRISNAKAEALRKQHEEGWRGLSQAEAAVSAPAAVAELEAAKQKGATEDELDTRMEMIAAEAECHMLQDIYAAADAEIQKVARRVEFVENKESQMTRLLPLARLLSVALAVKQDREKTGWVPSLKDDDDVSSAAYSVHTPSERAPSPGPLTVCARCNKEYHADPINNKHYSCRFHIGERIVTENWAVAWSCCRRATEGCRTAPHISQEENEAIMRSFLPPPMAPAYPPPMRFQDR